MEKWICDGYDGDCDHEERCTYMCNVGTFNYRDFGCGEGRWRRVKEVVISADSGPVINLSAGTPPINGVYKEFTIKLEHMKLLAAMEWGWNSREYGAPTVDPKKPYGNSGVIQDIIKIVGDTPDVCPHCGEHITKLDEAKYDTLHADMKTVLNILSQRADVGVKVGQRYVNEQYSNKWSIIE